MLDTFAAEGVEASRAATVVRMQIQPRHWPKPSQRDAQLKLCVPPVGVKGFAYRRVKNDERDAADLADLLRMGRLPQAWIAPPEVRGLREAIRHRSKLVAIRSGLKAQVHAVLAKQGVRVTVSDLFGVGGQRLLEELAARRAGRGVTVDAASADMLSEEAARCPALSRSKWAEPR